MKLLIAFLPCCSFAFACPVGCLDFFLPDIQATTTINAYNIGDKMIEQEIKKVNVLFETTLKHQKLIEEESRKLLELEKFLELGNQNQSFIKSQQNAVESKNSDIRSVP